MSNKSRILVAEDNEGLRTALNVVLTHHRMEVVACATADHALAAWAASEQDFDLAVIDVTLPDRSGQELIAMLREQGFVGPVVLCSGLPQSAAPSAVGHQAFLLKPYEAEQMLDLIERLLEEFQ